MRIIDKDLYAKIRYMEERDNLEEIILELEKIHQKDEKMLIKIESLKTQIESLQSKLPDDSHKKYLSEIIQLEQPEFGKNNLILAPVGSGKTRLIKDVLLPKDNACNILMLVSNRFLKDSIYQESIDDLDNGANLHTTKDIDKKHINSVYLMTYHEFGFKIKDNNDFMNNISTVFCDEIHSLPEYKEYTSKGENTGNYNLEHAIKYLFGIQENKQIFYFTATSTSFDELKKKRPELIKNVKVFDYREHPDIRRYMELAKSYITHIEQIRPFLKDRLESFNYFQSKGLAFAKTISSLKTIETILIEEGYKPLVLWSDRNEEHQLSDIQKEARQTLIETNEIPNEYNFLVMNSALREGWNLHDPKIRLAIMNTTNETDIIQARGRIRKDIDVVIYRTTNELDKLNNLDIANKYLNIPLTTEDKVNLCNELDIRDTSNRPRKWRGIKVLLKQAGYSTVDSKITIDDKRVVVTTIFVESNPHKK